jgi:protein-disulfide isomerase
MSSLTVPVGPEDHIRGNPNAPVTLVEYGDYQCPYCGAAHPVVQEVEQHFGDDLRFVFRHFPLAEMHPFAEPAAEAAEFAGAHGRFWDMHDGLYENQDQLGMPLLYALATRLGLSGDELEDALGRGLYRDRVRRDFVGGIRSGVNGTPTFFIGNLRYEGVVSYDALVLAIEAQMPQGGRKRQRRAPSRDNPTRP